MFAQDQCACLEAKVLSVRLLEDFDSCQQNAKISVAIERNGFQSTKEFWLDKVEGGCLLELDLGWNSPNPEYRIYLACKRLACSCRAFARLRRCEHATVVAILQEQGVL